VNLKVQLVSSWSGMPPIWLEAVRENHLAYAARHGYGIDFEVSPKTQFSREMLDFVRNTKGVKDDALNGELRNSSSFQKLPVFMMDALWGKVEQARRALDDKSVSFVFLSDCDSVFMNFSADFQDLVDMNKQIIFTGDSWDLYNGGHLFLRNTSFVREFLDFWLSFKSLKFEAFPTTHQSIEGHLSDQPVMNSILSGGFEVQSKNFFHCFSSTNGFIGNEFRKHKFFPYTHAPTQKWRLRNASLLIHKSLRPSFGIVTQSRLNSYEIGLPGSRPFKFGDPIIHLVGAKESVTRYCLESKRLNDY